MIDKTLDNRRALLDTSDIMTMMYGPFWVHRDDHAQFTSYYELLLESLRSKGALTLHGTGNRVHGSALNILWQFERDNKREKTSNLIQIAMVIVTTLTAAVSAVQVFLSYTQTSLHP